MSEKDQRNTRQRAAIRDAFEQAGRPLSPKQVLNAAQVKVAGFGDYHRLPQYQAAACQTAGWPPSSFRVQPRPICGLTTAIAIASALWADRSVFGHRALPWTAGILLGISVFWIIPEMADDRGWTPTLVAVSGVFAPAGGGGSVRLFDLPVLRRRDALRRRRRHGENLRARTHARVAR